MIRVKFLLRIFTILFIFLYLSPNASNAKVKDLSHVALNYDASTIVTGGLRDGGRIVLERKLSFGDYEKDKIYSLYNVFSGIDIYVPEEIRLKEILTSNCPLHFSENGIIPLTEINLNIEDIKLQVSKETHNGFFDELLSKLGIKKESHQKSIDIIAQNLNAQVEAKSVVELPFCLKSPEKSIGTISKIPTASNNTNSDGSVNNFNELIKKYYNNAGNLDRFGVDFVPIANLNKFIKSESLSEDCAYYLAHLLYESDINQMGEIESKLIKWHKKKLNNGRLVCPDKNGRNYIYHKKNKFLTFVRLPTRIPAKFLLSLEYESTITSDERETVTAEKYLEGSTVGEGRNINILKWVSVYDAPVISSEIGSNQCARAKAVNFQPIVPDELERALLYNQYLKATRSTNQEDKLSPEVIVVDSNFITDDLIYEALPNRAVTQIRKFLERNDYTIRENMERSDGTEHLLSAKDHIHGSSVAFVALGSLNVLDKMELPLSKYYGIDFKKIGGGNYQRRTKIPRVVKEILNEDRASIKNKIINISLVDKNEYDIASTRDKLNKYALFIFPAGNDGSQLTLGSFSHLPNLVPIEQMIVVGGHSLDGSLHANSGWGHVDISAPICVETIGLVSKDNESLSVIDSKKIGINYEWGTSLSAPLVAFTAGLVANTYNDLQTASNIKKQLLMSADVNFKHSRDVRLPDGSGPRTEIPTQTTLYNLTIDPISALNIHTDTLTLTDCSLNVFFELGKIHTTKADFLGYEHDHLHDKPCEEGTKSSKVRLYGEFIGISDLSKHENSTLIDKIHIMGSNTVLEMKRKPFSFKTEFISHSTNGGKRFSDNLCFNQSMYSLIRGIHFERPGLELIENSVDGANETRPPLSLITVVSENDNVPFLDESYAEDCTELESSSHITIGDEPVEPKPFNEILPAPPKMVKFDKGIFSNNNEKIDELAKKLENYNVEYNNYIIKKNAHLNAIKIYREQLNAFKENRSKQLEGYKHRNGISVIMRKLDRRGKLTLVGIPLDQVESLKFADPRSRITLE